MENISRTMYTTCTPRTRERKRFSLGVTSEPADDDDHDPIDILTGNLVIYFIQIRITVLFQLFSWLSNVVQFGILKMNTKE